MTENIFLRGRNNMISDSKSGFYSKNKIENASSKKCDRDIS